METVQNGTHYTVHFNRVMLFISFTQHLSIKDWLYEIPKLANFSTVSTLLILFSVDLTGSINAMTVVVKVDAGSKLIVC